jgi:hypothetical protein
MSKASLLATDDDEFTKALDGLYKGIPRHIERECQRHVLTGAGPLPSMLSSGATNVPYNKVIPELEYARPFAGLTHWNSLHWSNFPPLHIFGSAMDEYGDSDFYKTVRTLNSDGKLSEQWVTYGAAREDLCLNTKMPKGSKTLKLEVINYEGQRDNAWKFPLQAYMAKRDNHMPYEVQARRFWDNGVINVGVNAMDFSEKVKPVGEVDCYIHMNAVNGNPMWGNYFALMRINGWPFRISKIGSYEGVAKSGITFVPSIHFFDEQSIWDIIEGSPEMRSTNGQMELFEGNTRVGAKCFAMLYELDFPGPKNDESRVYDPEIPVEKGFVWFEVVDTTVCPTTGKKAVKVKLLDEGIVPCWMDLKHMSLWCGDQPLGYFNGAASDVPPESQISAYRVLDGTMDANGKPNAKRRFVCENTYSKIIFKDPEDMDKYDMVDMGWSIKDCLYKGATITVGGRQGPWIEEEKLGKDEVNVMEKSIRLPLIDAQGNVIDPPNNGL